MQNVSRRQSKLPRLPYTNNNNAGRRGLYAGMMSPISGAVIIRKQYYTKKIMTILFPRNEEYRSRKRLFMYAIYHTRYFNVYEYISIFIYFK